MITIENVMDFLSFHAKEQNKPVPAREIVEPLLDSIDQDAILNSWKSRIVVQVWDGISDINTASADYIRESNPWLDIVYTLVIDGSIVFMQTHDPFSEGWVPITAATLEAVSKAHLEQIAVQSAKSEICIYIKNELEKA